MALEAKLLAFNASVEASRVGSMVEALWWWPMRRASCQIQ